MPAFQSKQLWLTDENASQLQQWSFRYNLSESELVRHAIEAYHPEHDHFYSLTSVQEKEAIAVLEKIGEALNAALSAVDNTNARVERVLSDMNDPKRREAIVMETKAAMLDSLR